MIYRLRDICEIYDGPHATPPETKAGPIFLGIKNITENCELDFSEVKYLSEEDFTKWTKRVTPKEDDIVFSYEATLNRYALIPSGFHGCLGRRLGIARVKDRSIVNPHYLYHYFCSPEWKAFILANKVVGSTVLRISIEEFPEYKVDLPDIETQNAVSVILDAIAKKKNNNSNICSDLESMAKLLYDYWFVQFDFPDNNGRPYKSSGGKMIWNEELKREIPERWEVKRLRDVAFYVNDRIDSSLLTKDTYIGTDNLLSNMSGKTVSEYVPVEGYSTAYREKDILIANIRPYFKKIWQADNLGGASADVLVIRTEKEIDSWVYGTLARDDFFAYDMAGSKGSKMPRGDKDHIMNYPIPYSEQIIKRFSSKISYVNELRNHYYHENQQLASLRDFLLPMLMNGQVKVGKAGE